MFLVCLQFFCITSHYAISDFFAIWLKNFSIFAKCIRKSPLNWSHADSKMLGFEKTFLGEKEKVPSLYAEKTVVLWGYFPKPLQKIYISPWKSPFTIRRFQRQNITISGLKFTFYLHLSEINIPLLEATKKRDYKPVGQKNRPCQVFPNKVKLVIFSFNSYILGQ